LVNVPAQKARDEKAVEIFQQQWDLYAKFLRHDYLGNAGAYVALKRFLDEEVARAFAILDLACGDASGIVPALSGTRVARYRGVDLAAPALFRAAENLKALSCPVELVEGDFVTAMRGSDKPADIVWISLSLHHLATPDKLTLMREIRGKLEGAGAFLIYEPTRRDGEDRPAYLDRFEAIGRREWTHLGKEEFNEAMGHVRTCDLPETVAGWEALGREAGFARCAELYRSQDDLFRLFCYRA
jgi:SAM-dependent methyltransferase